MKTLRTILLLCTAFWAVVIFCLCGCNSLPDLPDWVVIPTNIPSPVVVTNAPIPPPVVEPEPEPEPQPSVERLDVTAIQNGDVYLVVRLKKLPFATTQVQFFTTNGTYGGSIGQEAGVWILQSSCGYWDIHNPFRARVIEDRPDRGVKARVAETDLLMH